MVRHNDTSTSLRRLLSRTRDDGSRTSASQASAEYRQSVSFSYTHAAEERSPMPSAASMMSSSGSSSQSTPISTAPAPDDKQPFVDAFRPSEQPSGSYGIVRNRTTYDYPQTPSDTDSSKSPEHASINEIPHLPELGSSAASQYAVFPLTPSSTSTQESSLDGMGSKSMHDSEAASEPPVIETISSFAAKRSAQHLDPTAESQRLARLGYTEELSRNLDLWAALSMTVSNMGFVSGAFFGILTTEDYGGSSALAFGFPITGIFMIIMAAVVAELAGTYPVAGAMYSWTFLLCRACPPLRGSARYISWVTGSFLLCGHILTQVLLSWQFAVAMQGCVSIIYTSYSPRDFHALLIAYAQTMVICAFINLPVSRSAWFWKVVGLQILATCFLAVISLLIYTSPKQSASEVFFSYSNNTGYKSAGVVYLLGWVLTCITTGFETAPHMSEETKVPARTIPRAVFWSTVISYVLGSLLTLVVLSSARRSSAGLKSEPRPYFAPAEILFENLRRPLALAILVMVLVAMLCQGAAQMLGTSRFTWALARDSALPFSSHLRHVSSHHRLPRRAILVVATVNLMALTLIMINSDIVTSLFIRGAGSSTFLAYAAPIAILLISPAGVLESGRYKIWTLRGFRKPMAIVSVLFVTLILIVMCFPTSLPVTSISLSYAPIVTGSVLILATLTWIVYGNSHYAGPIKSVTFWTTGGQEVALPKSAIHSTSLPGAGITSTEVHGKTAHVFDTSTAGQSDIEDQCADSMESRWQGGDESMFQLDTFDDGISHTGSRDPVLRA
ncbi:uncharacterized protein L969DRAFT_14610 [Mixia osmundae IAM 14324]|uniref:Amino acid permease/ SLC12A domain-containing protein n=1 Tax=Mixia osmundae (strain CBS 9802 / IAM 14324 / JCM 22182 / KY 12970) TaxID=764103 RepID=G7E2W0_MIXOS|nr:uncharacterized protein L969DRAFT_14610 [Mixia osmundae IAM 14324]KEI42406.1 hypothetical protein L969DRAFT_14610 [Mixia osmundae IAM 14324]GAA97304.1 hypothetical protein E5Q_03982 [Mixia osmundae IAM 14324]